MTNIELTKIREANNLSKTDLAKRIGITPMLLGRYESGKVVIPDAVAEKVTAEFAPAVPEKKEEAKSAEKPKKAKKAKKAETAEAAVKAEETAAPKAKKSVAAKAEKKEEAKGAAKPEKKRATRKSASRKSAQALRKPVESDYSSVVIEAQLGGQITVGDVVKKIADAEGGIPDGLHIYVKPEENKAYYNSANGEGSVDLW